MSEQIKPKTAAQLRKYKAFKRGYDRWEYTQSCDVLREHAYVFMFYLKYIQDGLKDKRNYRYGPTGRL